MVLNIREMIGSWTRQWSAWDLNASAPQMLYSVQSVLLGGHKGGGGGGQAYFEGAGATHATPLDTSLLEALLYWQIKCTHVVLSSNREFRTKRKNLRSTGHRVCVNVFGASLWSHWSLNCIINGLYLLRVRANTSQQTSGWVRSDSVLINMGAVCLLSVCRSLSVCLSVCQ